MGCGGSSDEGPPANAQAAPQGARAAPQGAKARAGPGTRPKGYNSPFMQRHSPNGEVWADYVAPCPPSIVKGKLSGGWAECVYSAMVFELTNPGWDQLPAYRDNGPVGILIEYLQACNYGQHAQALEQAEEYYRQELQKPAAPGSRAFLRHQARNGQTWQEYLQQSKVKVNKNGIVDGAWGECITAACIFEHENPAWDTLGPYSEDGPAGQVIAFLGDCNQSQHQDALDKTEQLTHQAIDSNGKIPVFDATYYQPPCKVMQAPVVNQPPPRMSGRKKAVSIGCNYPGTSAQLSGCIPDVHRWCNHLRSCGFQDQDIVQLVDEGQPNYQFVPTRSNIIAAVRWLVDGAMPGDCLFFHFSGHGGQRESMDDSEADGMDEVLMPTDYQNAGVIVDHELFDLLAVSLQSGVKLTVVLDCCHSGSALDLPFEWNEQQGNWNIAQYPWHTAGDVQMFSGCEDFQCSADTKDRMGRPCGAMTTALCDVLEGNEAAGSYPQLLVGLTNVLVQRGYEQRPKLSSSQPFDVNRKQFSLTDYIVPNLNPQLGQAQQPRGMPVRPNAMMDMFW